MSTLHILWDESYIWGLLAVRAARLMQIPYVLLKSTDIVNGALEEMRPKMLFVPGGNARHKAENLTAKGLLAIQKYVSSGGSYLGFCGGAGLALSHSAGLGLCPWQRAKYTDRLQHFMSGHLVVDLPQESFPAKGNFCPEKISSTPSLPVWWPGQFEAVDTPDVVVLARYKAPAEDFWLADLPIKSLPDETFSNWKDLYGLELSPTFLAGQPCVICGRFGDGDYLLSYSHLETPDSPEANMWLKHLFQQKLLVSISCESLPAWNLQETKIRWHDEVLAEIDKLLTDIVKVGIGQNLLFERNPWLLGWRMGIPGAHLNNLWAYIKSIIELAPSVHAEMFWQKNKQKTLEAAKLFHKGCTQYLMAERLSMTLSKSLPDALPAKMLKEHRQALFGAPMSAGGLYLELVKSLDELAFLQLR